MKTNATSLLILTALPLLALFGVAQIAGPMISAPESSRGGLSGDLSPADGSASVIRNSNVDTGGTGFVSSETLVTETSAAVEASILSARIRSEARSASDRLSTDIETNVDRVRDDLRSSRERMSDLHGEARTEVQNALDETESARADLRKTLKKARDASDANWPEIRAELAAKYDSYVQAATEARVRLDVALRSEGLVSNAQ